jgi:hypothetical protein
MTLKDAEDIVQEYAYILEHEVNNGPAKPCSSLPQPSETIVQALKLWSAIAIQTGHFDENTQNMIGTAVSMLPSYIDDKEAQLINDTSPRNLRMDANLSNEELRRRSKAISHSTQWSVEALAAGLKLRCDVDNFISKIKCMNPQDSIFWQRVYTELGLQYSTGNEWNRQNVIKHKKVIQSNSLMGSQSPAQSNPIEINPSKPWSYFAIRALLWMLASVCILGLFGKALGFLAVICVLIGLYYFLTGPAPPWTS